jgi:hypothetical protein
MIRVVMFDLGMTLVDAELHPFPHVTDADRRRKALAVLPSLQLHDADPTGYQCENRRSL